MDKQQAGNLIYTKNYFYKIKIRGVHRKRILNDILMEIKKEPKSPARITWKYKIDTLNNSVIVDYQCTFLNQAEYLLWKRQTREQLSALTNNKKNDLKFTNKAVEERDTVYLYLINTQNLKDILTKKTGKQITSIVSIEEVRSHLFCIVFYYSDSIVEVQEEIIPEVITRPQIISSENMTQFERKAEMIKFIRNYLFHSGPKIQNQIFELCNIKFPDLQLKEFRAIFNDLLLLNYIEKDKNGKYNLAES